MSNFPHPAKSLIVAAALSLGLGRVAGAQTAVAAPAEQTNTAVFRSKEPLKAPPLKPELEGQGHSRDAVWIPGFWDLEGDRATAPRAGWVWVPGRWEEPPVRGAQWDPGHWGFGNAWWSWIPGHWDEPRRAR